MCPALQTPYVPLWRFEAALCPGPIKGGVPTVPELEESPDKPPEAEAEQEAAEAVPEQEEESKVPPCTQPEECYAGFRPALNL